MWNTLIAALAGLVGAIIGAIASSATTRSVENAKAARERRQSLLGMISEAIFSHDRSKAVQLKVWMAIVADRQHLREWAETDDDMESVLGLFRVLLDPVNAERKALGLEELELQELVQLLSATADSEDTETSLGREEQAERSYRKAADAGDTDAMVRLGILLAEQGQAEQAEQWYRKAADAGNTKAMANLGVLLTGRGHGEQAEQWYRKSRRRRETRRRWPTWGSARGQGRGHEWWGEAG